MDCPKFNLSNLSSNFCHGNDCKRGIENCAREIHYSFPLGISLSIGSDVSFELNIKNNESEDLKPLKTPITKSDKIIKKLQYASSAQEHLCVLRVYADIIRKYHTINPLNYQEVEVAKTIQRDIHNYYSRFQKNYLSACKKGDTRLLKVTVNALRPY
jgi:hypothetical protein